MKKIITILLLFIILTMNNVGQNIDKLELDNELKNVKKELIRIDSMQDKSCNKIEKLIKEQVEKDSKLREELRMLFSNADEIVLHREKTVELWMFCLSIFATILSIGIPLAIWIISKNMFDKYKEQQEHINENMKKESEMIEKQMNTQKESMNMRLDMTLLEANKVIERLKNHESEGSKITEKLKYIASKEEKNEVAKEKAITAAKEIVHNDNATNYQKALAYAYDCYYSDKWNEAIKKYQEIIDIHVNEISATQLADVYFKLAYSYSEQKEYEKSIEFYDRCIGILPNDCDAYSNKGSVYLHLFKLHRDKKYIEQADELFSKASALKGHDKYDGWITSRVAEAAAMNGNYKEAITLYETAIEKENNDYDIVNNIECLIYDNQIENAKNKIHKYKEIRPREHFCISFLETIIKIIESKTEKSAEELLNNLKLCTGNSFPTTEFDLFQFKLWIDSEPSCFVNKDVKSKLMEFKKLLTNWEESI